MAIYRFSLKNKDDLDFNRAAVVCDFREITGYGLKASMDIIHQMKESDFVVIKLYKTCQKHPTHSVFFQCDHRNSFGRFF